MKNDINKLTNADRATWSSIGNPASSTAATYGVHQDGELVAIISRDDAGYMERATWKCRRISDGLICAFESTLKAAKAKVISMDINGAKAYRPAR